MTIKLDEIDIRLLTELQADADRTNIQLARLVGLSPAATLHRVRALKDCGVIRIVRAHVDPALAGFPLQVWVTATLARHNPRSDAAFEEHRIVLHDRERTLPFARNASTANRCSGS